MYEQHVAVGSVQPRQDEHLGPRSEITQTLGYHRIEHQPRRRGTLVALPRSSAEIHERRLHPADRASIVDRMRGVGGPQRWGVWAAGAELRPGVKNGWDYLAEAGSDERRWVTATMGFVGPGERYIVAALYDQPPGGLDSIEIGVHVLTDLVATVFGAPVPAPAVVPEDY